MGQKETNLGNEVDAALTTWQRLWRANCGNGWAGVIINAKNGILKLANFSKLELFPPGTADKIGFDSIIITQEMVGRRVAVFVGNELKATPSDKLKKNQINFKNLLIKMGGIHRETRPDGVVIESGFMHPDH